MIWISFYDKCLLRVKLNAIAVHHMGILLLEQRINVHDDCVANSAGFQDYTTRGRYDKTIYHTPNFLNPWVQITVA